MCYLQFSLLPFVVILYDPEPQGRFATERRWKYIWDHPTQRPKRAITLGMKGCSLVLDSPFLR
jgi:hypothetical protein